MVHLEGWNDGQNQTRFQEHARLMRDYATLFERYGVKLTWESKELTDGILRWGDNVLREMERRGHGSWRARRHRRPEELQVPALRR
jgi:hypothetical protein